MNTPAEIAAKLTKAERIAGSLSAEMRRHVLYACAKETTWSATHGWPSVRDDLQLLGLIVRTNTNDWNATTAPTPLGRAVRAILQDQSS